MKIKIDLWTIIFFILCIPTLVWCKVVSLINVIKGGNK